MRRRRIAIGLAAAAALAFTPTRPAQASNPACPGVWSYGAWTMLAEPHGLGPLQGAAVDAGHAKTVYVTDGQRVARSTNGGCAWRVVLDLAAFGPLDGGRVTSVVAPAGRAGRVYATVAKSTPIPGTAVEPVLASFDYGRTWHDATGLPPTLPSRLRASPADPDVMYLSMHTGAPADVWAFYASGDGGLSWTRRSLGAQRARFVPDPDGSDVVWALGSLASAFDGPYRSSDGGATWQPTRAQPANASDDADIDVSSSGRIVVAQAGAAYVSADGGASFRTLPAAGLAGAVRSVAFGSGDRDLVVASDSGVYRFLPRAKQWVDVDTLNLTPLADAARIDAREPSWSFWRPELVALYRERAPVAPSLPRGPITPGPPTSCPNEQPFSPAHLPRPPPASLTEIGGPLALQPSVPSQASFRLALPAVPASLDTYFLLDTSVSMGTAIDAVTCGLESLVDGLSRAGVDGQYGLGEFQDASPGGLRYRRDVDIGPPGLDLQRALRGITLAGGEEPHRGALYQTATGAGLWDVRGNELIAPHQQADYRADAYRIVLLVTDEPYMDTTTYEPTLLQVIDALNRRHIHHIGIRVLSDDPDPAVRAERDTLMQQQLSEFSRGTNTFAPPGGVDCDGDGKPDVPAGAPLVCTVNRHTMNLAQTLRSVLLAVRQDGVAALRPVKTDGMRVDVPAGVHVDVHRSSVLTMSAGITCTEAQTGLRHTLVMGADVSGTQVARTPFDVTCGAVRVPPPVRGGPVLVAAAPPAAAPAPAPVPVSQPALSASTSAAHGANAATEGGAVHGQVSVPAAATLPEQDTEPAAGVVRMVGAGVLFAAFAALEVRRRSRRSFAKAKR